jgi:hypothetical protein
MAEPAQSWLGTLPVTQLSGGVSVKSNGHSLTTHKGVVKASQSIAVACSIENAVLKTPSR